MFHYTRSVSTFFKSPSQKLLSLIKATSSPTPKHLHLISLDWTRPKDPPISLAQASLVSHLKKNNISVTPKSYSINSPNFHPSNVTKFIMDNSNVNTYVGIGAYIWNEPTIQKILPELTRQKFPGIIILGGPQINYTQNDGTLETTYPDAHIFTRGYAENSLVKLMQAQSLQAIPGIHYANTVDHGSLSEIDLASLHSPFLGGLIAPQPFIRWETKRGCPYRCAFCQHKGSNQLLEFPLSRIQKEVQWIANHPIINDIAVLDPTFNIGKNYLHVLKELTQHKFSGKISLQCRIERVTNEFLDAVTSLNASATTTLEFGLQTIHSEEQKIINRTNIINKAKKVFAEAKKRNINVEVSLIYGLPNQTLDSFRQSIQFCKESGVETIYAFPLLLLRGTALYQRKKELGLIESTDPIPRVITSPSFTYDQWLEMKKIAALLEQANQEKKSMHAIRTIDLPDRSPNFNPCP
jgi:hypothetical protein